MGTGARINGGTRVKTSGYVLVEVIASLVIFSIGIVAVIRAFSVTTQARGLAQDYTVANLLCQKLVSETRAMPSPKRGAGATPNSRRRGGARSRPARRTRPRQNSGMRGGARAQSSIGSGSSIGSFRGPYRKFQWEMMVKEEQPLAPQEREKPGSQRSKRRRSKRTKKTERVQRTERTKKGSKQSGNKTLQKLTELREITVTVSWERRGAGYDVSATALAPVPDTMLQELKPGREGQQGGRGLRRDADGKPGGTRPGSDGIMNRGGRSANRGARRNVGA